MLTTLLGLVASIIHLGLSSFGAYSFATETDLIANIPAVESLIQSLPL